MEVVLLELKNDYTIQFVIHNLTYCNNSEIKTIQL